MPANILFDQFSDMDEAALLFWEGLQEQLQKHDLQPVLIHYSEKARETLIPLVWSNSNTANLYESTTACKQETEVSQAEIDLVIKRTGEWGGVIHSKEHAIRVAQGCKDLASAVLDRYSPVLVVIWNGHHLQQMFLKREAEARGIPVLFMEKSPFPGFLFFDESGILAETSFAKLTLDAVDEINEAEKSVANDFLSSVSNGPSWYQQPESSSSIHQTLEIPQDRRLLAFFGQVDSDTQNFLFSPHFENNCQAWEWFIEMTEQLGDGYHRVGKHHPKSRTKPSDYTSSPVHRAEWREDISMDTVLQEASALASVNSSANTEGLAAGRPVLYVGGGSCFDRKNVAYVIDPTMSEESIASELDAWVNHARAVDQSANFQRCIAHMLRHHLVALDPTDRSKFGLSLESVANWLANHCSKSPVSSISEERYEAACSFLEAHAARSGYYRGIQASNEIIQEKDRKTGELRARIEMLKAENKSLKKRTKELDADIHSAEQWQRSWVKRVFRRWRPTRS